MDTRLIFRDYLNTIKTDAGTQTCKLRRAMVSNLVKRRAGEANPPGRLPGKSAKES